MRDGGIGAVFALIPCRRPAKATARAARWNLDAHLVEQRNADGTIVQQLGANPKGGAFLDADGHYIITVMRSDRAKYAIDNFGQIAQATAEENKATAQGTITYFGTYSVSEADRTIDIRVEASSFPNWNGTDLKRFVEITEDQLKLIVRPPRGGTVDVPWKRAK